MGVKEIFPLTKCDSILDLMFPYVPRCLDFLFSSSCTYFAFALDVDACTCILRFGILILEKTLCFTPHSQLNLVNVVYSSLINIYRKFAKVDGPL